MIAEALNVIQDSARLAAGAVNKVAVVTLPQEPKKYAVVKADGTVEFRDVAPADRKHCLGEIGEVAGFVKFAEESLKGKPSVWYAPDGVIVVVADAPDSHRADRAVAPLIGTQTYATLLAVGAKWLAQKDFVRLLRVTLADAATDSSQQLLKAARVISFSATSGGKALAEHGRQSLGRDIEEQVTSEVGDIPEEVEFNVRLFTDPGLTRRFPVRCAVDINAKDATFNLCPLAEQLDDALSQQLELIGEQLRGEVACPVFRGKP